MKEFVKKKLKIVGETHPHFGEEVIGFSTTIYESKVYGKVDTLICMTSNDTKFYVYDKKDIQIIK